MGVFGPAISSTAIYEFYSHHFRPIARVQRFPRQCANWASHQTVKHVFRQIDTLFIQQQSDKKYSRCLWESADAVFAIFLVVTLLDFTTVANR